LSKTVEAHASRAHAKIFSPSKADTWATCTAQPAYVAKHGLEQKRNEAMDEGTAAHELLDLSLKQGKHPSNYKGQKFNKVFVADNEMVNAVGLVWEWVQTKIMDGYKLYTERKVKIACTGDMGTCDIGLIKGTHLIIADLKYGKGVPVSPIKSRQMRLYACGFLDEFDWWDFIETLTLVIWQPRGEEEPKEWEDSIEGITYFRDRIKQIVKDIKEGKTEFKASEKGCQWCPAKGKCKTYARFATEQAAVDFESIAKDGSVSVPDMQSLTIEEIINIWKAGEELRAWIKGIGDHIHDALLRGETVPGLRLVEGKANRKWVNEGDVMEALYRMEFKADDYAPRSLLGLKAIESLFTDKAKREMFMKQHTIKPKGAPTVANADDPRPSYSIADEFAGIDNDNDNQTPCNEGTSHVR
jgi:hypothetical protein